METFVIMAGIPLILLMAALGTPSAGAKHAPPAAASPVKEALRPGAGTFTYHDAPLGKDLPVHYYLPAGVSPATSRVLFVMHGTLRNGAEYRDQWKTQADRYHFLLIVPEFGKKDFPSAMYNRGNILDENDKGPARPEEKWSFSVIERLFDHLRRECGVGAAQYYIYGHSAGGQFVHRLVLFLPKARYARAVAANSGYYTLPLGDGDADTIAPFPFSLKGTPLAAASEARKAVFGRDVVILLGESDTDPNDPDLYHSPEADQQGMFRLARGRFFFETARRAAEKAGVPLRWKLITVPGVGHSNEKMASAAAEALFGKEKAQ